MKEQLNKIVESHGLIDQTWEYFWNSYDYYLIEEPEESSEYGLTDRYSIKPKLHSISYRIRKGDFAIEDEAVIVCIYMLLIPTERYIGYYDCLFDSEGNFIDDFFVTE